MSFLPWVLVVGLLAACGAKPSEDAKPSMAPGTVVDETPGGRQTSPLIGTKLDLEALRWLTADGKVANVAGHRLTLVRWWTTGCPFCTDSLPALCELQRRFGSRGLGLVGVFHRKGPVNPTDAELQRYVAELGCTPVLARDDEWGVLRPLLARGGLDQATSISLLIDREGKVQWVQKGPRLHPSKDPEQAAADADYRELERLLDARLPR